MPNGKQMLNDLELEQRIASFSPAEQFLAREIYDMKKACELGNCRLLEAAQGKQLCR